MVASDSTLTDQLGDNTFLFCLSDNPNKPCLVVKWPDASVMLDCALDLPSLLCRVEPISLDGRIRSISQHAPLPFKEAVPSHDLLHLGDIDVILLSNSTSLLALPFITERTDFRGYIFATEPTLQFGRHMMLEIAHHVGRATSEVDECYEIPTKKTRTLWDDFYTAQEIKNCLAKVQIVGLNERKGVNTFGYITAVCSGYSIGSCNWVIEKGAEKIAYVSASSNLSTHSKVLSMVELIHADSLILSSLSRFPARDPDSMLMMFSSAIAETVQHEGNVLIPCIPQGLTYDLLECLFSRIDSFDTSNVSVYIVSEVARNCLAYANIYAEWLCDSKLARAFVPDEPFVHGSLVRNNRLKVFRSVYSELSAEFSAPCIVFASHPSLLFGDAVHFLQMWKHDRANTIIMTDPDYVTYDTLKPFLPVSMKVIMCPIDTRLTGGQVSGQAIGTIQPKSIYAHVNNRNHFSSEWKLDQAIHYYSVGSIVSLPCENRWIELSVEPQAVAQNLLQDVGNGKAVAHVDGRLSLRECRYVLQARLPNTPCCNGQLACLRPTLIAKKLEELGLTQIYGRSSPYPTYEDEQTVVSLEPNCTHVVLKQYDEARRQLIKRNILETMVTL